MSSERVRAHLRRGPSVGLPSKKVLILAIMDHYLDGARFTAADEQTLSFEYARKAGPSAVGST